MPNRYGESDEAFAIAECGLCDDRGIRRGFACDHVDLGRRRQTRHGDDPAGNGVDTVTPQKPLAATHSDEQVPSGVTGAGSGFKHVPADLNNPKDAAVVEALGRRCDLCGAPPGELCVKRQGIRNDLAGRVIHIGRMQPPHPPRRVR